MIYQYIWHILVVAVFHLLFLLFLSRSWHYDESAEPANLISQLSIHLIELWYNRALHRLGFHRALHRRCLDFEQSRFAPRVTTQWTIPLLLESKRFQNRVALLVEILQKYDPHAAAKLLLQRHCMWMHALHVQFEPLGTVAVARVDAEILEQVQFDTTAFGQFGPWIVSQWVFPTLTQSWRTSETVFVFYCF